ncbi:MAG: 5'/3'-nucleotidase SurE [Bacteroidetes bacterium]|nr:MAG: 5'/3'-nucleotidase SurE [Bacteroidota bacterium]
MNKPLILITNDDSISAPGIRFLINVMRSIGEVVIVAPEGAQSAKSHSITITNPLRYNTIEESTDYKEYSLNGTPVDCVKFALHKLLDRKPDIIVSGINHGSNASINIIYSGTMAAATEGAMGGIPSIGFSILDYSFDANFNYAKKYIIKIVNKVLAEGLPSKTALNVNFPMANGKEYNGIKVCRQADGYWRENFEERLDPRDGKPYYWLKGDFLLNDKAEDTDEFALSNYYVSLVPVKFDFTDYSNIKELKSFE